MTQLGPAHSLARFQLPTLAAGSQWLEGRVMGWWDHLKSEIAIESYGVTLDVIQIYSNHFRIGDLISIDVIPFRRCWFQITYTYSILFLFLCVRDVKLPPTFCSGYLAIYRYPIRFCCRTCRYRWMVKNCPAMVVWLCSWAERSTGNENTKGSRIWICRRARTLLVNTCKHEM